MANKIVDKIEERIRTKYKTMINRASMVTMGTPWNKLNYNEMVYIRQGVDRMLDGDYSRGGYGGKFKRYILKGGRQPKSIK